MRVCLASLVAACLHASTCQAAQIEIHEPDELKAAYQSTKGVIEGATAVFGTPFEGQVTVGRVVFAESKLNQQYCDADDYDLPPVPQCNWTTNYTSHIVLVTRGHCADALKVRIAQDAKRAFAVIVVDSDPGATEDGLRHAMLTDDGSGAHVRIPSVLVTHSAGQRILGALRRNQTVFVKMAWDAPVVDSVCMDMWITPSIPKSLHFVSEFSRYAQALKHRLDFEPRYWIFSFAKGSPDMCLDDEGTYCALTPRHAPSITGRDVVHESLRQLCLWDVTKTRLANGDSAYSEVWWKYAQDQPRRCKPRGDFNADPSTTFGQECSYRLMASVGAPVGDVRQCVERDAADLLEKQRTSLAWFPMAIRISEMRYFGPLDTEQITRVICAHFQDPKPQECNMALRLKVLPLGKASSGEVFWLALVASSATLILVGLAVITWSWVRDMRTKPRLPRTVQRSGRVVVSALAADASHRLGHPQLQHGQLYV